MISLSLHSSPLHLFKFFNFLRFSKEDILAYNYIRMTRLFLWPLGFWPGEVFGENVPFLIVWHRRIAPLQTILLITGELIYVYKYSASMDFLLKGYSFLCFFLTFLSLVRIILTQLESYKEITKTFIEKIHMGNLMEKSKYDKQVFDVVEKLSYYFTIYLTASTYSGMFLFCTSPLYLNYKNGYFSSYQSQNATYECIACFVYPYLMNTHEFTLLSTIYSIYITYPVSVSLCGIDLLLSLMTFQVIGHIFILKKNLETLHCKTNAKDQLLGYNDTKNDSSTNNLMFNDEENYIIHKKLVKCINHHKTIVFFTDKMSTLFGPVLGFTYGFHIVSQCLLLIELSSGSIDAILRFGTLTAIVFAQLIVLSVLFEVVSTLSEKLKDSVYFSPWEKMNTRNRRTVIIMLCRVQRPIEVTAMGLTKVGVTPMAQILKATISYYMMLRSLHE